jgi:hypothetical protein
MGKVLIKIMLLETIFQLEILKSCTIFLFSPLQLRNLELGLRLLRKLEVIILQIPILKVLFRSFKELENLDINNMNKLLIQLILSNLARK